MDPGRSGSSGLWTDQSSVVGDGAAESVAEVAPCPEQDRSDHRTVEGEDKVSMAALTAVLPFHSRKLVCGRYSEMFGHGGNIDFDEFRRGLQG
jgi:hypothetical protein